MMTVVASSRLRPILHFGIALLAVSPIAAAFYQELGALSRNARLFAAAFAVTISAIAVQLMMMHLRRLGAARLALVLVITLLGILLGVSAGIQFPSADYARISYSDGTYTDHQGPTDLAVWGKSVKGYSLHPAFSSVRVPNGLTAEFASAPNQLTLLFSKPQEALLNKDGTPTPSDGVSLEVKAFDANGQLLQTQKYDIPEKEFLEDRWVTRTILSSSGISKAQVSVFTGPPGSTPDFDSTNVAFEVRDLGTYALFFGKMLLVASGFFVGSLLLVVHFRRQSGTSVDASGHSLVRRAIPYLSVLFLVSLIAYWSMSRSTFIYFWDYRNYWQKTEALYELIAVGAWTQAIGLFANFYAADYSLWPAVLPALLSLITGYPTSLKFAMISTVIYAVPAYIMVAWLGARLLEGDAREQTHRGGSAWVFASLLVFFAFPMFFVPSLYLMPDIGGVVLFVAALLLGNAVVREIARNPEETDSWKTSAELLRSSLGLGIMFSLMFVFRRWYVFAAVGIGCSCAILIGVHAWTSRQYLLNIVERTFVSAVFGFFAALPFLCWILFDWSREIGQHDYSSLYASYKTTARQELTVLLYVFGLAVPTVFAAFILVARKVSPNRKLLFILLISSVIASLLFLQVQSPGRQHYYLLMPLLGAPLAALGIALYRSYGLLAPTVLTAVLVLGNAAATWARPAPRWIAAAFPSYAGWLPKTQPYQKGFVDLTRWLLGPESAQKPICVVASSAEINEGVFYELWQIVPELKKGGFDTRIIQLGQVDSWNGPPPVEIRKCEIALVGIPFQTHLQPGQQTTLQIVQEDLVAGTGIGAAFARSPREFVMDGNIKMLAYVRTREISDAEYSNLVERFLRAKGPGYVNPTP